MSLATVSRVLTYVRHVFDTEKPIEPTVAYVSEKSPCKSEEIKQPFARSTPEETGLCSSELLAFLRDLRNDRTLNMHTVTIIKNSRVVCQASFGAYDFNYPSYTFSACKSVTSLAIGMLIGEKKLSLDENLADIFPDEVNAISRLKYKEITVRDVLTMRSTVLFNEAGSMVEGDWEKAFFSSLTKGEPGKTFNYNSLNTYMLSRIVKRKSGLSLFDYLTPRLFAPLGIENIYWEKCPSGIEKGGWGLYICPEDFAKIGKLVLDGGSWNGKQLVPSDYLADATRAHVTAPSDYGDFNYGYQIWVGRKTNSFLFNGMFGQNVLCFRDTGIIIVSTAGNGELFQQSSYFKYVAKYFNNPKTPDRSEIKANKQLISYISELTVPYSPVKSAGDRKREATKTNELCSFINGKYFTADSHYAFIPTTLQIVSNSFSSGLTGVGFKYTDKRLYVTFYEKNDSYRLSVGIGEYISQDISYGKMKYRVAVSGRIAENEDYDTVLKLRVDFIETPCSLNIKFIFANDEVKLISEEYPGSDFLNSNILSILKGLEEKPMISSVIGKLDENYIRYRVEKKLSPSITLFLNKASDGAPAKLSLK